MSDYKFFTGAQFEELDFSRTVTNWRQDSSGVQYRRGNSRYPLEQLSQSVNRLEARWPSIWYSQSFSQDYAYWGYADPLVEFQHFDYNYNARDIKFDFMVHSIGGFEDVQNYAYTWKTTEFDNYKSGSADENSSFAPGIQHISFTYQRDEVTNELIQTGISQEAGECFEIWDAVVQEQPFDFIDTSIHRNVKPYNNRAVNPPRTNEIEELRSRFHEIRTQNLPRVLNWSAQTETETPATALSHSWGICIDSATDVNIWDQTETARTATSPGPKFYGYNAGIGNETNNRNIHCVVAAKLKVIDGSGDPEGYITFYGPDHVTGNLMELSTTSTNWEWVGGTSSDFIYMYSGADFDDTSTEQNKVDIFGRVTGSDKLQIAGVCAWVEFNKD
jgi:hypothetical protein